MAKKPTPAERRENVQQAERSADQVRFEYAWLLNLIAEDTTGSLRGLLNWVQKKYQDNVRAARQGKPVAAVPFTQAEFDDTFDSPLFGDVRSGDPIPYIAEHQGAFGIGVGYEDLSVNLGMHAVDSMPTAAASEGRRGGPRTDSYAVFDLRSEYQLNDRAKIFAVVENIFDREYAVALRPAGARPGRPQTFMAGLTVRF